MTENLLPTNMMTPQRAKELIALLGYESWTKIPFGASDYLDALVHVANSNEPVDLNRIRDASRRSMKGRI